MKLGKIILKVFPFCNGPDREDAEKKAKAFGGNVVPPDEIYLRLNVTDNVGEFHAWGVVFNTFSSLQECLPITSVGEEVEVIQYERVRSMHVVRHSKVEEV